MVSGSILDSICKSISKDLTQFATPCSIQLQSRRFGTVAALRVQRIGYPPPPRSGWSGVCKSRCPARPISNFQPYLMFPGGPPRALKCPRQPPSLAGVMPFFDLSWPSWAIFGHLSPNMLPRSSQLDAKIAQDSPTCGQDRPKYSPRASNQTPQRP